MIRHQRICAICVYVYQGARSPARRWFNRLAAAALWLARMSQHYGPCVGTFVRERLYSTGGPLPPWGGEEGAVASEAFPEGERVEWRCRECRRRVRLTILNPDHAPSAEGDLRAVQHSGQASDHDGLAGRVESDRRRPL